MIAHVIKKSSKGPKTEMSLKSLPGVPHKGSRALAKLHKQRRSVARAYGGVLTHDEVRER